MTVMDEQDVAPDTVAPDTVAPDTKDWTWVLERPCGECGYVAEDVELTALPGLLTRNAVDWSAVLHRPDVRRRPAAVVWSPLEYGCHVRDVHRTMRARVVLMLEQDSPEFPDWDQDATAVEQRYGEQDPAAVADELLTAAAEVASAYEMVTGPAWHRTGLRSNGSRFTVGRLGRYHLHDVVHHLRDVAG